MKKTLIFAFLAITTAVVAHQAGHKPITMLFTDTDAAYVLQAISKQTGQQILYSNKNKLPITINLTVDTIDDAIRAVDSAGGLVSRKVGLNYIVAPRDALKEAIAPYAHTQSVNVPPGTADKMLPKLQDGFPFVTFRAVGDSISITGANEDIEDASDVIRKTVRAEPTPVTMTREIYTMQAINAADVVPLLKTLYPEVESSASGTTKAAAGPSTSDAGAVAAGGAAAAPTQSDASLSYGFVALKGPEPFVRMAIQALEKLDVPPNASGPNRRVYRVYNLKYANGPSLQKFLRSAAPEIQVYVGPEQFSPLRADFNPMGQQLTNAAQAGSSGAGGSGGSSGGGSASTGGSGGAAGQGAAGAGTPGHGAPGDRAKSIVMKGRSADLDAAVKLIQELDVRPRQVVIEVKVIETSPVDSSALGVSYTFSPVNFYDVSPSTALTAAAGAVTQTAGSTQSLDPSHFSRTPLNFQATLNAMVSKQTAKLLATPSLQVIDNDQGSIFIGNTVSVELSSVGSLGAASQSIAQFPVGIILLVSPRISPDGRVTIHVNPVISSISSLNAQGIPQTSAREADTTMILKDGETTVLGGLIQDQDTKTVSEVPWLSQLPIIGQLFRNTTRNHTREDILVSITPHIVKDDDAEVKK